MTPSNGDRRLPVPDVSVIVPTRNRARLLGEVLDSLAIQTLSSDRFEIIVVDNVSSDDTPTVMAERIRGSCIRLIYHVMPENRGPARSRNTGARIARGSILAFTDDDCRPAPEWLEAGMSAFSKDVGLVTGPVRYKPEQTQTFFARDSGEVFEEHPTYTWTNSFYRRDVFEEMNGTDERLCHADLRNRVVDCGDTDLAWRVKEAGYRTRFSEGALVYHELDVLAPIDWICEPLRLFVVPQLVRRHPQLRSALLFRRLFFVKENALFYLAVVSLPLALVIHWTLALLSLPYVARIGKAASADRGWLHIHYLIPKTLFLILRQAAMCAALVYGSLRYRCLVL